MQNDFQYENVLNAFNTDKMENQLKKMYIYSAVVGLFLWTEECVAVPNGGTCSERTDTKFADK